MDLYNHEAPSFTAWVVANKLLREPLVVVDVGVQGGEHPRWAHLGEFAHVHGFDAIQEVIDGLKASDPGRKTRSYHALALGNEDGQREFQVAADTYGSSFFSADRSQAGQQNGISLGKRTVEIRRLDTLFAAGMLPAADYLKIDCEGFEPEVLRGAHAYLARSGILCVSVETNFGLSPVYPRTPFAEINELLVQHRLLVFDLNAVRTPRPGYAAARAARPWPAADPMTDIPDLDVGQPGTFDFVFCRDFVRENTNPDNYGLSDNPPTPAADKLIKSMIIFELHGLMDCAVEIAEHFRPVLAERLDVDLAIRHLLRRPPQTRNTAEVTSALAMIWAVRQQVHEWQARVYGLQSEIRERDVMNTSVRFLAKTLMRELAARLRRRFAPRPRFAGRTDSEASREASNS